MRLNEVELKTNKLKDMDFRIDSIKASITTLLAMETDVMETKKFLERELPLLTHYQICEGLNSAVITEGNCENIRKFERTKLDELVKHVENMDLRMPRLKIYRTQIFAFGKYCSDMDQGVVPFKFLPEGDWWGGGKDVDP